MENWQERTAMLLGEEGAAKLRDAHVSVIGVGGVGGFAAETLARAGVGHLLALDSDIISETNRNRQILALSSTVGRSKCDVLRERLLDINPEIELVTVPEYITEENIATLLDPYRIDFLVDAIDTLSPKICLIQYCLKRGVPMVSSMGAGAKLDATAVRVADIAQTRMCPLAHMLRKRLHKLGIFTGFDAVFSVEEPRRSSVVLEESRNKKSQVGTISYLPSVFGAVCAQVAIRRIVGI
ncbi:MAG: tRNA threonylcarbamoyladenosine dehydratase [Bacteroidales bacterium]|nr:tRNA threonylcarbamoyladenosine dehydratase [Bacteroidales bacterium]